MDVCCPAFYVCLPCAQVQTKYNVALKRSPLTTAPGQCIYCKAKLARWKPLSTLLASIAAAYQLGGTEAVWAVYVDTRRPTR